MASYHLGNNSNDFLEAHSSIQYNDRLYSSASQALEDYIKDYNRSLVSPEVKPGKIRINYSTPRDVNRSTPRDINRNTLRDVNHSTPRDVNHSTPRDVNRSTPRDVNHSTLRDFKPSKHGSQRKYALENFKEHAVKVPVSPLARRKITCDSDLLSLTTDDLLAFPPDGSMSFNQVITLSKTKRKSQTSASYAHRWTASFDNKGRTSLPGDPVTSSSYKDFSRKVPTKHIFHKYDSGVSGHSLQSRFAEPENSGPVFHKNYPRWLTSQKSDLSVSGISSIPDCKYPIWLDSHNLLPNSDNESLSQAGDVEGDSSHLQRSKKLINGQKLGRSNDSRHSECNGLADQQNKGDFLRNCHDDCRKVHFRPDGSGEGKHSWRENDPKALLLKVERSLETSTNELASVLNNSSPRTVDVLEAERSWDNVPFGLKSPVPVYCEESSPQPAMPIYCEESPPQRPKANMVDEFLEDCLKNSSEESTFSGGNHHGPVEALKLMLFNLQIFQQSLKKTAELNEVPNKNSEEDIAMNQSDADIIPVTKSLQRALHHLSRLKALVEDPCSKEEST